MGGGWWDAVGSEWWVGGREVRDNVRSSTAGLRKRAKIISLKQHLCLRLARPTDRQDFVVPLTVEVCVDNVYSG